MTTKLQPLACIVAFRMPQWQSPHQRPARTNPIRLVNRVPCNLLTVSRTMHPNRTHPRIRRPAHRRKCTVPCNNKRHPVTINHHTIRQATIPAKRSHRMRCLRHNRRISLNRPNHSHSPAYPCSKPTISTTSRICISKILSIRRHRRRPCQR